MSQSRHRSDLDVWQDFAHNEAMVKVPDIQKQPAGIVLVSDSVDETAFRIPPRRVLGSTGISVAVHAIVVVCLSLVLMSQKEADSSLHTLARFEEPGNSEDSNWVEIDVLELPPVQEAAASMRELTSLTTGSALLPSADVDLSRFGNQLSEAGAADGLPSEVAAIAGAVQGRVSKAGGRTGEVQFALAWESFNDLDLHVITPAGEHLSYSHRKSRCNGELDVDMNAGTQPDPESKKFSDEPVENIRWLTRRAPTGRFTVLVHQYGWRSGQNEDKFQLVVNLGEKTQVIEGVVTSRQPISIHRFQYVLSSLSQIRQKNLLAQLTSLQEREEAEATKLLERAMQMVPGVKRDQALRSVIGTFPHTDASIRAMQEVEGIDKN